MIQLLYTEKANTKMSSPIDASFSEDRDRLHLQMMSAVSHDLKTPLASIIGSLEIHDKMKEMLTEEKKEILLKTALEEAYRLDGFITNILDMARIENGMTKVHKRHCELEQVIQDCIQKISDITSKTEITVVKPFFSTDVETDSSLLSRAVLCLLDNALKHSGNQKTKIQISFEKIDSEIAINIKDNGSGIPEGEQEAIFNKYTRLAKKDYKNAGTGLGLTIARAILKLLGGTIYLVKSDIDGDYKGANFAIKIPVQ